MKIEEQKIKIRDLIPGFTENEESGRVSAMNGELDIRPEYQREFVYKDQQRDAVINTILHNFPLNTMYFVKREDGTLEVMDGQQRIISICQYADNQYSIPLQSASSGKIQPVNFPYLSEKQKETFLEYPLQVYICEGTDQERLDWFQVINIAGEKLSDQEIRNALFHGQWLTDAKSVFSRRGNIATRKYGKYLRGDPIRQEVLETALRWKAQDEGLEGKPDKVIPELMKKHRYDQNADELWAYFESVFKWVQATFGRTIHKSMKGVDWGRLYNEHRYENLDPAQIQARMNELLKDDEIQKPSGIYEYLLTGDERLLNLRQFRESEKQAAYNRQKGICPICRKHFEYEEMDGDHIRAWTKGGKTTPDNLQMLCKDCNQKKGYR